MDYRHVPRRRRAFARAGLALALAGCSAYSAPLPDRPVIYYDLGASWTTTKREVHLYGCRRGVKVCTGEPSRLDVTYHCHCE